MILQATNIEKTIKGKNILHNINLTLQSGRVYGFVGRNGSGKTMLFRALSGLMRIDKGTILLDDKMLHKDMEVLPNLGILLENVGLYPELTGYDNLKMLAGLNHKIGDNEIRNTIERVGLDPNDKRSFKKYSLGMKQRILLAQALMEQPDIIILDEPTNALDEQGVEDIRNIIKTERERGALILIASHNKQDIEALADQVYDVQDGCVTERGERNEA